MQTPPRARDEAGILYAPQFRWTAPNRPAGWTRHLRADGRDERQIGIAVAVQDVAGKMVARRVTLVYQVVEPIAPSFKQQRERVDKIFDVGWAAHFVRDDG